MPRPLLKTAAILTIIDSPVPEGGFRPPYSGTDKTIKFYKNQLDYSKLSKLAPPASTPRLEQQPGDEQWDSVERMFERVWYDLPPSQISIMFHPADNMHWYGANIAGQIGTAGLMLNLDFTDPEKETLLIGFVQLGIDLYGIVQNGGENAWACKNKQGGRKLPILFAGIVLDDLGMKSIGEKSGDYAYNHDGTRKNPLPDDLIRFAEDENTFWVTDEDIYSSPYELDYRGPLYLNHGTVNVVNGSTIVTGVGTAWTSSGVGKYFAIVDGKAAELGYSGYQYKVASVNEGAQTLELDEPFQGYTENNAEYVIAEELWFGHADTPSDFDCQEYTAEHNDLPDWGKDHIGTPRYDGLDWGKPYRHIYTPSWKGLVLAAHIIGAKAYWNHDALFDYMDRYVAIEGNEPGNSWDMYRASLGGVWTRNDPNDMYSNGYNPSESDSAPPLPPTNLVSTSQTSSSISLSWAAPSAASDGDSASSYKIVRDGTVVGLTAGTPFQDAGLNAETTYSYEVYSIDDAGNLSTSAATGTFSTLAKGNQPPNANAGANQTLTDSDGNGSEQVTLDGSGSTDPDGTIQSYVWSEGGTQIATGVSGGVTLPVGQHTITLTVTDNGGLTDTDTVIITINPSNDNNPPTVTSRSPEPDSIQVPLNNLITLHIVDAGTGVDADTVTIQVDGDTVYTGDTAHYSTSNGDCRRTGTKADYAFTYQSNETFDFEQEITVTVNATDLGGNTMPEYSYSFWTEMRSFGQNKKASSGLRSVSNAGPVTVCDSSGNIWAAWHAGQTGSRNIYLSTLAEGADDFGNSIQLTDNLADQCNPAIALDGNENLYVVWQDNRRGNWDIYISISGDGASWSAARRVTDSNDNEVNPAIAIDNMSANRAHVVWQDDRGGNQDIYVATSSDAFATKAVSQITFDGSDQTEPAVAVDSDNTIYVVWTDARASSTDIFGVASSDGWNNVSVVGNANNQSSPAIATEAAGSILHLLWIDDTPADRDIYYTATDGLPASPLTGTSIMDDSSGANQLEPVIAVTGSTGNNLRVFTCWQDRRNVSASGDTDLYFVKANSGGDTNIFIGDDGTNADQSQPAMGIDGYGHPYLVWSDSRDTNAQIYYAGSTFIDLAPLASDNVSASTGRTVGTPPSSINDADDVSVIVPPGACPCDARITISEVKNPQTFAIQCLAAYDFGPSGMQFNQPVTITIPYSNSSNSASAYWYDSLTGALSQQGITDVKDIVISPTLHALQFKTTHFTQFYVGVGSGSGDSGGSGGGGGCSISATGDGSIIEFLVPYIGLAAVVAVLKLRDVRNRKACRATKCKC